MNITGILEGEKRENEAERVFERIMADIFTELMTNTKPPFQEDKSRINTKNIHLRISYVNYRKPKTKTRA